MPETPSHKRAKAKAAGKSGKQEVPLSRGRRLDAATKSTATEVERQGKFVLAARRLRDSGKPKKVLQVPQKDMPAARAAMRKVGIGGTVKNMTGSKVSRVPKPK